MNGWITDRLPTAEDADVFYKIMVPCTNDDDGWDVGNYTSIELGDPWAPWPKMPPYEPEPEYWSCPEDIPKDALWFLDYDGDCDMVQTVTSWGLILAQNIKVKFGDLKNWRWSDRPVSKLEDGKPCVKETSDE